MHNFPWGGWWTYIDTGITHVIPDLPSESDKNLEDIKDGCVCKKCDKFYEYAIPNQRDGTLICYSCRIGW